VPATIHCDIAILGGGLAGGLTALALAEARPELKMLLVEAGERLGGNHVWSFFDSDVAAQDQALIDPLVVHRWSGYDIAFPRHARTLDAAYHSVTSERLDAVLRDRLNGRIMTSAPVVAATATRVTLADQRTIVAGGVIDTRGAGDLATLDLGWQKFVGRELRLAAPHGLTRPTVMDATVAQIDGYRFVYVLPFGPDRLFVEDTYYSTDPTLDCPALSARIDDYAAAKGWQVVEAGRQETGVLPVAMGGDFGRYWASTGADTAKLGVRAGLFHPTTGYSLPDAIRAARMIAAQGDLSGPALAAATRRFAKKTWDERGFYRLLDRMLFRAAEPAERYKVLERFYRLDAGLVGRFYAGRSTLFDKARILAGKPPVPLGRAMRAMIG
jgi:lycopene beta-cyclase